MTDTTQPSIQEVLSAAMLDIGAVAKGEFNDFARYNFRGIDAVVNASSPAFKKHGIVVMPNLVSVRYDDVKTSQNKVQTACRVVVDYTFTGPAGDQLHCTVAGEAWDGGDKATPQAMSVAFRIALLQALCLPTHDPEVDARRPYERVAPEPMTSDQLAAMQAGFKAAGMSGDEGRDARLALFKDLLKRDTNGGDLTTDEAATVIEALSKGEPTPEQQANLEQALGAQPIEEKPPTPAQAATEVGRNLQKKAAAEREKRAQAKQAADETDSSEGNI